MMINYQSIAGAMQRIPTHQERNEKLRLTR